MQLTDKCVVLVDPWGNIRSHDFWIWIMICILSECYCSAWNLWWISSKVVECLPHSLYSEINISSAHISSNLKFCPKIIKVSLPYYLAPSLNEFAMQRNGVDRFHFGEVQNEDGLALIFINAPLLQVFANAEEIHMVGKFRSVPRFFTQMACLHVVAYGHVIIASLIQFFYFFNLYPILLFRHSKLACF